MTFPLATGLAKHEFTGLPAVSLFRSTHSEAPEVTQRVSTIFSLAQKLLARVGVRTDSTTHTHSHDARRGQFSAHAHWHSTQDMQLIQYAPRVCTSVLFINPRRACAARVTVVNPRRACAARVTVVVLCVCLSVC